MVQIHDAQTHLLVQSVTAFPLTLKQHLVLPPIEQPGQRVGGGLALKLHLQRFTSPHLTLQIAVYRHHLHQQRVVLSLCNLPTQRGEKTHHGWQHEHEGQTNQGLDAKAINRNAEQHSGNDEPGSQQRQIYPVGDVHEQRQQGHSNHPDNPGDYVVAKEIQKKEKNAAKNLNGGYGITCRCQRRFSTYLKVKEHQNQAGRQTPAKQHLKLRSPPNAG
ncbi:hypothetical protein ULG90_24245 [Halopseudomonas pachastrellae]|nr:hypothetical protein ULG90_24245 [Halopseudomonas pachastrellae]